MNVVISGRNQQYNCVEFSPNGNQIAFSSDNGFAKLWDLSTNIIHVLEHDGSINDITFSPDGKYVLAGCTNNKAYLWNSSGKKLREYSGHKETIGFLDITKKKYGVSSVSFSSDGQLVLTGSQDGTAKLWKTHEDNKVIETFHQDYEDPGVLYSAYSSSNVACIAGYTGKVKLFDSKGTKTLPITNITHLEFSSDGSLLFTSSKLIAYEPLPSNVYEMGQGSTGELNWWNSNGKHLAKISTPSPTSFSLSPNNTKIAIGNLNGELMIWNLQGKHLGSLKGHNNEISSLDFSPDGTRMISASRDGTLKLWDVNSFELLATFLPGTNDSNDFLIYLPNGYYYSTTKKVDHLHYIIDDKSYSFQQFDTFYNRPDIVLQKLGYSNSEVINSYTRYVEKRIKTLGLENVKKITFTQAPSVLIDRSQISSYTTTPSASFNVNVADSTHSLSHLHILVNGVPIFGKNGFSLSGSQSFNKEIIIKLSNGRNVISVSADNEQGISSSIEQFSIFYDGKENLPNLYFIGIGSGKFKGNYPNHEFNASVDIHSILDIYKEQEGKKFKSIFAKTLVDSQVTIENIQHAKNDLKSAGEDDLVIVFYTGHGLLDHKNGDYFLSSYVIDFEHPKENGIPYPQLENLLDSIPSRKKLLLVNACNSGEYDPDPTEFSIMKTIFSDLRKNSGTYVISSSTSIEWSYTSATSNSVFGRALMQILSTKDHIKASELKELVRDKVRNRQTPTLRQENLEMDFAIW